MRWIARIIFILLLSSQLWGQHTTVTATVLDPNGTPYVNCTGSANFVGQNNTPGSGPYTLGGGAFQTVVPIFCDSFGKFTVSLASNNVVTPTPSQWNFQITSATGYVPGNTYSFNTLITITGATQDVGSLLTSVAPVLPVPGGGPSIPLWNTILPPIASLSLNMGLNTTSFTFGDAGASPKNFWSMLDSSTSSTDTSVNFSLGTGNNSYHQPLSVAVTTGGQTFAQLQVGNVGPGHVGITVVGNIMPVLPSGSYPGLPGNAGSPTGIAKFTVMDNSAQHTSGRFFQNNIVGTGNTLADIVQFGTAAIYNASTLTFNFWTACSGATQYNPPTTFGNGLCGGSNPGTVLASLRGDGTLNAFNYIGPLNGVSIAPPPLSATGYVPTLTSQTTATWQAQAGGPGSGCTGTLYQLAYFSGLNTCAGVGPGTPGQVWISRGSGNPPIPASAGVAGGNSAAGVVSTNTYTIACDDPTLGVADRLTTILFTFSGTVAATLPPPSTSGCGNNFTVVKLGASTGTTVNVTSSATLVSLDGNSVGSTLTLTPGQYASINSPDNTVYHVWKTFGIGPNLTITGNFQAAAVKAATYQTTTNCAAAGTAANPSVVSCSAAPSGSFSCDPAASTGTCVVNTTAITANSRIFVQPSSAEGTNISVTCLTSADTGLTAPRLAAKSAATSFTINMGTFTTHPLCFNFWVVN